MRRDVAERSVCTFYATFYLDSGRTELVVVLSCTAVRGAVCRVPVSQLRSHANDGSMDTY